MICFQTCCLSITPFMFFHYVYVSFMSRKIKKILLLQINTFSFSDWFVLLLVWVSLWEPSSMFFSLFILHILQKYICLIQRDTLKDTLAKKIFFSCFVLAFIPFHVLMLSGQFSRVKSVWNMFLILLLVAAWNRYNALYINTYSGKWCMMHIRLNLQKKRKKMFQLCCIFMLSFKSHKICWSHPVLRWRLVQRASELQNEKMSKSWSHSAVAFSPAPTAFLKTLGFKMLFSFLIFQIHSLFMINDRKLWHRTKAQLVHKKNDIFNTYQLNHAKILVVINNIFFAQ